MGHIVFSNSKYFIYIDSGVREGCMRSSILRLPVQTSLRRPCYEVCYRAVLSSTETSLVHSHFT